MTSDLKKYMQERGEWISSHLLSFFSKNIPETLLKSMAYSLNAGGKRIRPLLVMATLESLGKEKEWGLEMACAIEMVHTYSLIHDDLPAMDNDDFRRGIPTNHKVFGDGIAILAGDALLTFAFQLITSITERRPEVPPHQLIHLIHEFSKAIGPEGMVGGQVLDLEGEHANLTLQQLEQIHRLKTGALIHFSVYAGAVLGLANQEQIHALSKYARNLGLAFQIQDDILDIIGDKEKMGKSAGSDVVKDKSTYPKLMGMEKAKMMVAQLVDEAKTVIQVGGINPSLLTQIADFMVYREY